MKVIRIFGDQQQAQHVFVKDLHQKLNGLANVSVHTNDSKLFANAQWTTSELANACGEYLDSIALKTQADWREPLVLMTLPNAEIRHPSTDAIIRDTDKHGGAVSRTILCDFDVDSYGRIQIYSELPDFGRLAGQTESFLETISATADCVAAILAEEEAQRLRSGLPDMEQFKGLPHTAPRSIWTLGCVKPG